MARFTFELYVGPSPDGSGIHPYYQEGRYASLDEAKAHAETIAGRSLKWQWMSERTCWRAETGLGQAAEIREESGDPVRLVVNVGPM